MQYPDHLQKLIECLKRLPGVGSRSAERYAFHMLEWENSHLGELSSLLLNLPQNIQRCPECGALMEASCRICTDGTRDPKSLCIVSSFKDVFAIEGTGEFKGHYHVLDGLLSPLDRRGPEKLRLPKLNERIKTFSIEEILLALDSTLEGDATSLYLKKELAPYPLKISRLAFGLPMGSSLDYVDHGTLARALLGRSHF